MADADKWEQYAVPNSTSAADKWEQYAVAAPVEKGQAITDTNKIQAGPSTWQRLGRAALNTEFPFIHPFAAAGSLTTPIENLTQQGRAGNPALSRIGDVTAGAKELGRIIGPELATIGPGGLAETGAKLGAGAEEALSGSRAGIARMVNNPLTGRPEPVRVFGTTVPRGVVEKLTPRIPPEEVFQNRVARGVENAKVRQAVKQQMMPSVSAATPATAPTEIPSVAPEPEVMRAPEPNPTPAGVREGSAFSVPREQIPSMIKSGSAGAGDVFRSTGGKLIYEPRGAGIRNVRESVTIPEETGAPKLERESFGENTHQITANVGGQHVGSVMYSLDPDRIATVDSSLMTDPFQGKGIGKQMYDRAIQDAAGRGAKEFRSGSNPEPAARSLWENYLAKKYPVEKMDGGFRIPLMTR